MENPPTGIVTWAEVHAAQEEAERLGLLAHLGGAHAFRYSAALRQVTEYRTAYEERKRAEREKKKRAAARRVRQANAAKARAARWPDRADALTAIAGQAAS